MIGNKTLLKGRLKTVTGKGGQRDRERERERGQQVGTELPPSLRTQPFEHEVHATPAELLEGGSQL